MKALLRKIERSLRWVAVFVVAVLLFLWFWPLYTAGPRQEAAKAYAEFQEALRDHEYEKAYSMMSQGFREREDIEKFKRDWNRYGDKMYELDDESDISAGLSRRSASVCPYLEKVLFGNGLCFDMIKEGQNWRLTGEVAVFLD